ncbi:MAG TPA: cupin domain-containing protein [Candidatus Binataceae bacterium]|nr:cupin domain-containing protein [Candidatus Binataceae bacterium]
MSLPQDISPCNSQIMDSLTRASQMEWIPMPDDPERAFMKILWTGSESGAWAVLLRWLKGYTAPAHKHLSGAHTFVLSGKLQVRTGILQAGDYLYEANGMVHGATTALEDTEYLFICNGPVLFFDENKFTSYLGWEELRRIQEAMPRRSAA